MAPIGFDGGDKVTFTDALESGNITFLPTTDFVCPAGTYEINYYAYTNTTADTAANLELFDGTNTIPSTRYSVNNLLDNERGTFYGQAIVTFEETTNVSLRVVPGSPTVLIPPTFFITGQTISASIIIKRLV